jgi:hypothetical protein
VHPEVGLGVHNELKIYSLSNYLHHVTRHSSKVAAVYAVSWPSDLARGRSISASFAQFQRFSPGLGLLANVAL